jgi:hypothetical protein
VSRDDRAATRPARAAGDTTSEAKEANQVKPLQPELTYNVANQSERAADPVLIVLHTTQGHNRPGLSDLSGLGHYFNDPSNQVSSHIANDAEGHDARYVPDHRKSWTCAYFNSLSLNIEQIGFARPDGPAGRRQWFDEAAHQLANTARWIAHWSRYHGIPIRRARVAGRSVLRSGVAFHSQLGLPGGSHTNPGRSFPIAYVLWMARYFKLRELGKRGTWRFRRARHKANRIRRHYGLEDLR